MLTNLYIKSLIILLLLSTQIKFSYADSFRCNNQIVKTGDTTVEVKLKCGQPFEIENVGRSKLKNKYVKIIRYTYVPEKGKLIKILEFQNGRLVMIESGPRV